MATFNCRTKTILQVSIALSFVMALTVPALSSPGVEGLLSATPDGPNSVILTWNPAQQDQHRGSEVTYSIYQATEHGRENYERPSYTTKGTTYRVTGLASNTRYYFVVRVKDQNNRMDSDRVERSAVTFGRWIKKSPVGPPPPRLSHSMTYDSDRGQVILFGGFNSKGFLNDLWIYDAMANTWQRRFPATAQNPSPRTVRNLAYVDRQVMVIGGKISVNPAAWSHEVWLYNLETDTWIPAPTLADRPGYGISPQFVYDSANKVIVLFGGWKETGEDHHKKTLLGETWEFDVTRNVWSPIFPSVSPLPRTHHAMVYDSVNRRVILFGGETRMGESREEIARSNETWIYDAATDTWKQMFPAVSPSPRSFHETAYDSHTQQVILFGGFLSDFVPAPDKDNYTSAEPGQKIQPLTNETWVYDVAANHWMPVNSSNVPSPRFHHAMAYDPAGKKIIMFGGGTALCNEPHCVAKTGFENDTWVYE